MASVLVAYASKHGSTAEIAEAIADTLRESGLSVDCVAVRDVSSLERYDAVVLGSAVYMKRWRGDAKRFLRRYGDQIPERPFWVFSSGPIGSPKGEVNPSWLEPPRIVEQVERLGAREHVVFGGRMPTNPHGPARAMVNNCPPEYRDRRDWDEIHAWAAAIASEMHTAVFA